MFKKIIDSAVLVPDLAAHDKDAVLGEMVDAMVAAGAVDKKFRTAIVRQLREREARGSTGLGNGVAVPHVKEASVGEIVMGVGIAGAGIPFDAIDGAPVSVLFLVLGPRGRPPEDHLQVLRLVSGLARNADFRRFARIVKSSAELLDLLHEMTETV